MLANLPVELLHLITSCLDSEYDINTLTQTNRQLYHLVNPYLYRHNVQYSNCSALFWAATHGKTETAKKSIEAGANGEIGGQKTEPNWTARRSPRMARGCTPLTQASRNGHVEIVKLLSDLESVDANRLDTSGRTALHWAVDSGRLPVVKLLLASDKVKANTENGDGDTSFSCAIQCCNEANDLIKLLMKSDKIDIDKQGSLGKTALSHAAETGSPALVQSLLDSGRVNQNHSDDAGMTPLLCAIEAVNLPTFKVLWDYDKVDRRCRDTGGQTVLHIAVNSSSKRQDYEEILKLLIDSRDVDINAEDTDGSTPLAQAVRRHSVVAVKLLLLSGNIDVNCRYCRTGDTPLHMAAFSGDYVIGELILGHDDIDVNATNLDGCTALSMLPRSATPMSYWR